MSKLETLVGELFSRVVRSVDPTASFVRFQGRFYTGQKFQAICRVLSHPFAQRFTLRTIDALKGGIDEAGEPNLAVLVEDLRFALDEMLGRFRALRGVKDGRVSRVPDLAILMREIVGDHPDLREEPTSDARFEAVETYVTTVTDGLAREASCAATHFEMFEEVYDAQVFRDFCEFVGDRTTVREFAEEILEEREMWAGLGARAAFSVGEQVKMRLRECLVRFFEPSEGDVEVLRIVREQLPRFDVEEK